MRERHRQERAGLAVEHLAARRAHRGAYLAQVRAVKTERAQARPTGLAAFLGRVTGVSFVLHKLHRHRDAQAFRRFVQEKAGLALTQRVASQVRQRRHELQALDMVRQVNALGKVETRERKALDLKALKEQRVQQRQGHDHMPALTLDLKPKGRGTAVRRAKDRYRDRSQAGEEAAMREAIRQEDRRHEPDSTLRRAHDEAVQRDQPWTTKADLAGDFARAAGAGTDEGSGNSGDGVPALRISRAERKGEREQSRRRGRDDDFEMER
jgi:hypothetical protein